MDLWRQVLRSELSFSRKGTCRRPEGLIAKSLKLKCCSRSSLPKVFSNTTAQIITEGARKEKNCSGVQKLKDHQAVRMNINKNDTPPQILSRKHLWRAPTLVFQLFKQFDFEKRCFIFKFQKLFSHRIFKNGYLDFLIVCRNVPYLCSEILYLDLLN